MCLAVPMKIEEIHERTAIGEADGVRSEIRVDFIQDLQAGDYVMVHAGFALQKITQNEAEETAELMKEMELL